MLYYSFLSAIIGIIIYFTVQYFLGIIRRGVLPLSARIKQNHAQLSELHEALEFSVAVRSLSDKPTIDGKLTYNMLLTRISYRLNQLAKLSDAKKEKLTRAELKNMLFMLRKQEQYARKLELELIGIALKYPKEKMLQAA